MDRIHIWSLRGAYWHSAFQQLEEDAEIETLGPEGVSFYYAGEDPCSSGKFIFDISESALLII